MRVIVDNSTEVATEIDRHDLSKTGTNAGRPAKVTKINGERISFGDLARFACPNKTAAWLAHTTQRDVRTCERWLAEHNEPPAEAMGVVMAEIMRRYQRR